MSNHILQIEARVAFKRQLRPFGNHTAVNVICSECRQNVPSDMNWQCGFCCHNNYLTETYSFLNRCQKCEKEPRSFLCPHCEMGNFFDSDKDLSHPAHKIVERVKPVHREDPEVLKHRDHEVQMKELEREIEKQKKLVELAKIKSSLEPKREKTEHDKWVEYLVTEALKTLGLEAASPDARKILMEKFKDQPEVLGKIAETLNDVISHQDEIRRVN